ncbi:MAG: adenosylcobinamide-GDP ribazoletransferase [Deltaproteobacteria bacterium]|nr:adenosylcobinamide-GDP ribazoletransferase [Deltaproteobacteria bacterium]
MDSFLLALRFLTIIPLGQGREINSASVAAAGKYYPLVGALIGGLVWFFFYGVIFIFPTPVSSGLVVAFWVVLTGALHLDGLADCLDGLYGGTDQDGRLRIMKDVHLGTMGIVGLILILGIKYLALKEIVAFPSLWLWIILIPMLSRWTPIFLCYWFPYARPSGGLGQALVQGTGKKELFWATLLAWGPALIVANIYGLGLIVVALFWSLVCGWYFFRKLGGITGDVMGAVIESTEVWGMLYVLGVTTHV